jgi:hypothetical protein
MPVEILRMAEAARRLGMSTYEMVKLVHAGQIEYVLVDRVPRIPSTVVEEMLNQRRAS